jgi:hypothetical protein
LEETFGVVVVVVKKESIDIVRLSPLRAAQRNVKNSTLFVVHSKQCEIQALEMRPPAIAKPGMRSVNSQRHEEVVKTRVFHIFPSHSRAKMSCNFL